MAFSAMFVESLNYFIWWFTADLFVEETTHFHLYNYSIHSIIWANTGEEVHEKSETSILFDFKYEFEIHIIILIIY